jgi:hypothetical protein
MKPTFKPIRNKGSTTALLPDRRALRQLTKGDPQQQSMSNYAKLVPSGRNGMSMPDIIAMGQKGIKIE